jgi:hypothetical protein
MMKGEFIGGPPQSQRSGKPEPIPIERNGLTHVGDREHRAVDLAIMAALLVAIDRPIDDRMY